MPVLLTAILSVVAVLLVRLLQLEVRRRQMGEKGLQKAESRWTDLLQTMPLAIIEIDRDFQVLDWNPGAELLFGYTKPEVVGHPVVNFIVAEEKRERVCDVLRRALAGEGDGHHLNENVARDGRVLTCHWHNTLITGPGGSPGILCVAHDLTEATEIERRLRHSQKIQSIGMLAAGVAHDFNNLLTIIQGSNDLVSQHLGIQDPDISAEAREHCERVAYAADRAAALTRQLLCFSRQNAMRLAKIDANAAVESCAHMLSRILGSTVKLRLQLSGALPQIEADANLIEQVLTNLVVNARDAMPQGGHIRIWTSLQHVQEEDRYRNPDAKLGDAVRISVLDTGEGIPPDRLERIFEPFFTTKGPGKGTGLGLAAVLGIVQQHGGWINVRSWVGRGTIFEVLLPACGSSPVCSARPPGDSRSEPLLTGSLGLEGSTILLVEDEDILRDLCCDILRTAGCEVLEAASGADALRIWAKKSEDIDVLFTDMMMPGPISGMALSKLLRTDRPSLPVVFCSGYSPEMVMLSEAECAPIFLQKPFRQPEVLERVLTALQRDSGHIRPSAAQASGNGSETAVKAPVASNF